MALPCHSHPSKSRLFSVVSSAPCAYIPTLLCAGGLSNCYFCVAFLWPNRLFTASCFWRWSQTFYIASVIRKYHLLKLNYYIGLVLWLHTLAMDVCHAFAGVCAVDRPVLILLRNKLNKKRLISTLLGLRTQ